MHNHRLFAALRLALVLAAAACAAPADDPSSSSAESELQALSPDAFVGAIDLGESVVVTYTKTPLYRVLRYTATAGDQVSVKVARAGVRAEDMRVWLAYPNGAVLRAGQRGEVSSALDRDGEIFIVLRHERLEDAVVTVTLTGAHASRPVFDLPAWAMGRDLALPIDCTVNGTVAFRVNGVMRVEPGTALEPRAALSFREEAPFADGGDLDKSIGHKLLTEDLATYYGARAPVGLFQHPASYGRAGSWGERLAIEEETPARFGVFFEYSQGSTPNVYKVRGPSAVMNLETDGIAFSFARRGSNAMDYPNHSIACTGKAYAGVAHPCAHGYAENEGVCTRPPAPVPSPRAFAEITAAPYSTCALDTAGKVTCWGPNRAFVRPGTYKQVVAGEQHHCGLTTSDELECWRDYGADVNWNTLPYETFSRIALGRAHACGVRKANGTVRCWGSNDVGQSAPPAGAFVDVVAAADHSCGLTAAGAVQCWGNDYRMRAAPPPGTFVKLAASPFLFCGLRDTGALVCWGSYVSGIHGNMAGNGAPHDFGGAYVDLAAGSGRACGIDASHVAHCVGMDRADRDPLSGGLFTKIAFGALHACAIDVDGEAHCFGSSTAATNPPRP